MKKIKTEITETDEYSCDICGEKCSYSRCKICFKDLCEKHTLSDYDADICHTYCHSCWNIGEKYRITIKKLNEDCYKEEESLTGQWKKEALVEAKKDGKV